MNELEEAVVNFYENHPGPLTKEIVENALLDGDEAFLKTLFNLNNIPRDKFIGSSGYQYETTASNYFKGEEHGEFEGHENIVYLYTDKERSRFLLQVKNGQVYLYHKPLHTLSDCKHIIFVMNTDGRIYAGHKKLHHFHHSSFLAGQDVVTAGELGLVKDKLYLSADSGHYSPSLSSLKNIILELVRRGVDINQISVLDV